MLRKHHKSIFSLLPNKIEQKIPLIFHFVLCLTFFQPSNFLLKIGFSAEKFAEKYSLLKNSAEKYSLLKILLKNILCWKFSAEKYSLLKISAEKYSLLKIFCWKKFSAENFENFSAENLLRKFSAENFCWKICLNSAENFFRLFFQQTLQKFSAELKIFFSRLFQQKHLQRLYLMTWPHFLTKNRDFQQRILVWYEGGAVKTWIFALTRAGWMRGQDNFQNGRLITISTTWFFKFLTKNANFENVLVVIFFCKKAYFPTFPSNLLIVHSISKYLKKIPK